MTYSQNISRLKESGRRELSQSTGQRTAMAERRGRTGIEEARDVASKLSDFSTTLGEWKERDIKQKIEEGVADAKKARLDKAKKLSAEKEQALVDFNTQVHTGNMMRMSKTARSSVMINYLASIR